MDDTQPQQEPDNEPRPKAGQQMLLFLSEVAIRTRGDYKPEDVAAVARLDARTIKRFEAGEHWPRDLERVLSAYATLADIQDPRDLWREALDAWYRSGSNPAQLTDEGERMARAIKERDADAGPRGPLPGSEADPEARGQQRQARGQNRSRRRAR